MNSYHSERDKFGVSNRAEFLRSRQHRSISPNRTSSSRGYYYEGVEDENRPDDDLPIFSRIYINYPWRASRRELFDVFAKFGRIENIWVIADHKKIKKGWKYI